MIDSPIPFVILLPGYARLRGWARPSVTESESIMAKRMDAKTEVRPPMRGVVVESQMTVTQEMIRNLAYAIYVERMRKKVNGDALGDWLMAEKELGVR